MGKTELKELEKSYQELKINYIRNRQALKDQKREELIKLKDEYKVEKMKIKDPLEAEKLRIKLLKKEEYRKLNAAPRRSLLEEIGNAITHGVGAILGIIFTILMILKADDALSLTAALTYGLCFFFQMLFSCLYHSFRGGSTVKNIFRRFDYSSIYLQIGGSFAPLFLIYMPEKMWGIEWGLSLFIIQWVFIITGITFVSVFGPGRIKWLHFTLYFVIGWSGLMFIPTWIMKDLPLLFWVLGGGIVYTLGMIPFAALNKKPVSHFIWHFVVLIGAIFMWIGMYLYVF